MSESRYVVSAERFQEALDDPAVKDRLARAAEISNIAVGEDGTLHATSEYFAYRPSALLAPTYR